MVTLKKIIAFAVVLVLLGWTTYVQIDHANLLTDARVASYGPVRDAGLWIKENSQVGDKVLSVSHTQMTYYTEREIIGFSRYRNQTALEGLIDEERPRYFIWSVFEPVLFDEDMRWIMQWSMQNEATGKFKPVNAYYTDEAKTQVSLVIYEIVY